MINCIQPVSSFDPDYLDYYNFLECIVRAAKARPWTEEEQAEMPHFDSRLERICALMDERYLEETRPVYIAQKENFE